MTASAHDVPINVRLPVEVTARADALAASLAGRWPARMTRSAAVKLALVVGLHALEQAVATGDVAATLRALAAASGPEGAGQ